MYKLIELISPLRWEMQAVYTCSRSTLQHRTKTTKYISTWNENANERDPAQDAFLQVVNERKMLETEANSPIKNPDYTSYKYFCGAASSA